MSEDAEELAAAMWEKTRVDEQCARLVPDDRVASEVRTRVRQLARKNGVRIRTARMGVSVVIVRLDTRVWNQDAATMRRKLTAEQ